LHVRGLLLGLAVPRFDNQLITRALKRVGFFHLWRRAKKSALRNFSENASLS
jgi:hypothetical protein